MKGGVDTYDGGEAHGGDSMTDRPVCWDWEDVGSGRVTGPDGLIDGPRLE